MPRKAAAKAAKAAASSVAKSAKKFDNKYLMIALLAVIAIAAFLWLTREPDHTTARGGTGAAPAYTGAPPLENREQPKEGTKVAGVGEFQYA